MAPFVSVMCAPRKLIVSELVTETRTECRTSTCELARVRLTSDLIICEYENSSPTQDLILPSRAPASHRDGAAAHLSAAKVLSGARSLARHVKRWRNVRTGDRFTVVERRRYSEVTVQLRSRSSAPATRTGPGSEACVVAVCVPQLVAQPRPTAPPAI